MKLKLTLALILFSVSLCAAQKNSENAKTAADLPLIFKKQIFVDELDAQAKNLALPGVRIFVRTELAKWLWRNGKDETGRAETLAVKAAEELYEKKSEIADASFLSRNVLPVLDKNAKEALAKLRVKYNIKAEDLFGTFPPLKEKGNAEAFAESIKSSIAAEKDFAATSIKISHLQRQNSPEAATLLAEIINLHETGRNTLSAQSLLWISRNITDASVPKGTKLRFYRIVLNAARNAVQAANPADMQFNFLVIKETLSDLTANAPELAAEANALRLTLLENVSQRMRDLDASEERIKESPDKLAATIAEAEKNNDATIKYSFYREASDLALREGKFQLTVDLAGKAFEMESIINEMPTETISTSHDLQLNQTIFEALKKDDVESAAYASKKIVNDVKKAESYRLLAIHYHNKKDSVAAFAYYDDAFKLVADAKNDKFRLGTLFSLIAAAAEIDRSRVPEAVSMSVRAINQLPTLNQEDKPGTEKYKDYASTIMTIDLRLFAGLSNLMRKDKTTANDFIGQISRKEIKIIAEMIVGIDSIENERKISRLR